jgi:hypothetical protein
MLGCLTLQSRDSWALARSVPVQLTLPHLDVAAIDRVISRARSGVVSTTAGAGEIEAVVLHAHAKGRVGAVLRPFSSNCSILYSPNCEQGEIIPEAVTFGDGKKKCPMVRSTSFARGGNPDWSASHSRPALEPQGPLQASSNEE